MDWNHVNNLIVSGGEDCCYRIFDSFGLPIYTSNPHEHVITSVSWRPNGSAFAVGSYNVLRLCDRTGWTYGRERPEVGSVMKIKVSGGAGSGGERSDRPARRTIWREIAATSDPNPPTHPLPVVSVVSGRDPARGRLRGRQGGIRAANRQEPRVR